MQHSNGMRGTVMAMVAASAALMLAGCQSGDSGSHTVASSPTRTPSASESRSGSPDSAASASTAADGTSAAPAGSPSAGSGPAGSAATTCAAADLKVAARQATDRPKGTGTGAAVIEFTNTSEQACDLKGHPTVAGAANGSPQKNSPLSVTRTGSASSVRVAPGGSAWVKLTFVQVQGEADGYCASGSDPVVYPTLVIGLPGSGAHQVALDDGQFAECENKVTVTAVTAAEPS
ncbi:DUF4232 domain-containing protein [Streptomyces sp. NPDC059582]|uniref:DUF4232 domain-containing protein n=1 Tax=Streptomyces sp. NPDC059582 TaxID=3346875 RepID=UPI0036B8CE2A